MIKHASLCPFCNSGSLDCVHADEDIFFVECQDCHSTGPTMSTAEKALFVWGLRDQVKEPEQWAQLIHSLRKGQPG